MVMISLRSLALINSIVSESVNGIAWPNLNCVIDNVAYLNNEYAPIIAWPIS
ncbi:hypothetical protein TUM4444_36770 [Shewanella sp. MBTL60-112-B1]|nr:hypothetical protein TUM4444_36770 [Shewanella sp. MBTL60-112-B1]